MQNPTRALAFVTGAILLTPVIAAANTSLLEQDREGAAQREVETNKGHVSGPTSSPQVRDDERGTLRLADAGAEVKSIQIDLSAQPLSQALREFSRQTGVQIAVQSELAEGKSIERLSGKYQPAEALAKLLKGTGLSAYPVNGNTYGIRETGSTSLRGNDGARDTGAIALAQNMGGDYTVAQATEMERVTEGDGANKSSEVRDGGGEGRVELEEIFVTAQKRKENLQDVPISITVLSGAALDRSSFVGATDALRSVPGLDTTNEAYSGGVGISARGVSNATLRSAGAGPVAYYIDGVPYGFVRSAFFPDPSVYDLQQIEFLGGPQGTLYGANALNGVLRILTNDANADRFELKARTSLSTTSGGGENTRGDVAVNIPIVEGKLGARLVAGFQNDSGWIDVRNPLSPAQNRDDVNDSDRRNYRIKLHAQPSDTLALDVLAWRMEADVGGPPFSNDVGQITAIIDQPSSSKFDVLGFGISKEFSSFSISSMTSYLDYNQNGKLSGEPVGAFGTLDSYYDAKVLTEEINLVSSSEGLWKWSAGAFYRQAKDSFHLDYIDHADPTQSGSFSDYDDTSDSYAIYGELGRHLTEDLQLTAGLRYFRDEGELELGQDYARAGGLPPLLKGQTFKSTSKAVTPRAVLTWIPSAKQTFYASYSQGFRSGFPQSPNVQVNFPGFTPADPDKLHNYEVGTKGSTAGGLFSYTGAIFFIDWKDIQQSLFVDLPNGFQTTAIVNGESASGVGAEIAATLRPFTGLELAASVGWNDLTFDENVVSGGTVLFAKGERLVFSPEYTVDASVQYSFPIGRLTTSIALTGGYTSKQTTSTTYLTANDLTPKEIFLAGARVSVEAPGGWTGTLYADNLNDERDSPNLSGSVPEWSERFRPRTVGLQLEYRF